MFCTFQFLGATQANTSMCTSMILALVFMKISRKRNSYFNNVYIYLLPLHLVLSSYWSGNGTMNSSPAKCATRFCSLLCPLQKRPCFCTESGVIMAYGWLVSLLKNTKKWRGWWRHLWSQLLRRGWGGRMAKASEAYVKPRLRTAAVAVSAWNDRADSVSKQSCW